MKFKVEDIQGRHIVVAGVLLYLLSLFVGLGFTGTAIEEPADMNLPGPSEDVRIPETFKMNPSSFSNHEQVPKASEMVVPVAYLKKIFLNNLGLNAIIILGAFSLLTFSLIVLIFNALHVGLLLKGIYTSYGFRLAASLIMPHLLVEVVSHILSLYLAYLILKRIIVPVILKGEGIDSHSFRISQILALFSLVILITLLGALIEIYVTPKLI